MFATPAESARPTPSPPPARITFIGGVTPRRVTPLSAEAAAQLRSERLQSRNASSSSAAGASSSWLARPVSARARREQAARKREADLEEAEDDLRGGGSSSRLAASITVVDVWKSAPAVPLEQPEPMRLRARARIAPGVGATTARIRAQQRREAARELRVTRANAAAAAVATSALGPKHASRDTPEQKEPFPVSPIPPLPDAFSFSDSSPGASFDSSLLPSPTSTATPEPVQLEDAGESSDAFEDDFDPASLLAFDRLKQADPTATSNGDEPTPTTIASNSVSPVPSAVVLHHSPVPLASTPSFQSVRMTPHHSRRPSLLVHIAETSEVDDLALLAAPAATTGHSLDATPRAASPAFGMVVPSAIVARQMSDLNAVVAASASSSSSSPATTAVAAPISVRANSPHATPRSLLRASGGLTLALSPRSPSPLLGLPHARILRAHSYTHAGSSGPTPHSLLASKTTSPVTPVIATAAPPPTPLAPPTPQTPQTPRHRRRDSIDSVRAMIAGHLRPALIPSGALSGTSTAAVSEQGTRAASPVTASSGDGSSRASSPTLSRRTSDVFGDLPADGRSTPPPSAHPLALQISVLVAAAARKHAASGAATPATATPASAVSPTINFPGPMSPLALGGTLMTASGPTHRRSRSGTDATAPLLPSSRARPHAFFPIGVSGTATPVASPLTASSTASAGAATDSPVLAPAPTHRRKISVGLGLGALFSTGTGGTPPHAGPWLRAREDSFSSSPTTPASIITAAVTNAAITTTSSPQRLDPRELALVPALRLDRSLAECLANPIFDRRLVPAASAAATPLPPATPVIAPATNANNSPSAVLTRLRQASITRNAMRSPAMGPVATPTAITSSTAVPTRPTSAQPPSASLSKGDSNPSPSAVDADDANAGVITHLRSSGSSSAFVVPSRRGLPELEVPILPPSSLAAFESEWGSTTPWDEAGLSLEARRLVEHEAKLAASEDTLMEEPMPPPPPLAVRAHTDIEPNEDNAYERVVLAMRRARADREAILEREMVGPTPAEVAALSRVSVAQDEAAILAPILASVHARRTRRVDSQVPEEFIVAISHELEATLDADHATLLFHRSADEEDTHSRPSHVTASDMRDAHGEPPTAAVTAEESLRESVVHRARSFASEQGALAQLTLEVLVAADDSTSEDDDDAEGEEEEDDEHAIWDQEVVVASTSKPVPPLVPAIVLPSSPSPSLVGSARSRPRSVRFGDDASASPGSVSGPTSGSSSPTKSSRPKFDPARVVAAAREAMMARDAMLAREAREAMMAFGATDPLPAAAWVEDCTTSSTPATASVPSSPIRSVSRASSAAPLPRSLRTRHPSFVDAPAEDTPGALEHPHRARRRMDQCRSYFDGPENVPDPLDAFETDALLALPNGTSAAVAAAEANAPAMSQLESRLFLIDRGYAGTRTDSHRVWRARSNHLLTNEERGVRPMSASHAASAPTSARGAPTRPSSAAPARDGSVSSRQARSSKLAFSTPLHELVYYTSRKGGAARDRIRSSAHPLELTAAREAAERTRIAEAEADAASRASAALARGEVDAFEAATAAIKRTPRQPYSTAVTQPLPAWVAPGRPAADSQHVQAKAAKRMAQRPVSARPASAVHGRTAAVASAAAAAAKTSWKTTSALRPASAAVALSSRGPPHSARPPSSRSSRPVSAASSVPRPTAELNPFVLTQSSRDSRTHRLPFDAGAGSAREREREADGAMVAGVMGPANSQLVPTHPSASTTSFLAHDRFSSRLTRDVVRGLVRKRRERGGIYARAAFVASEAPLPIAILRQEEQHLLSPRPSHTAAAAVGTPGVELAAVDVSQMVARVARRAQRREDDAAEHAAALASLESSKDDAEARRAVVRQLSARRKNRTGVSHPSCGVGDESDRAGTPSSPGSTCSSPSPRRRRRRPRKTATEARIEIEREFLLYAARAPDPRFVVCIRHTTDAALIDFDIKDGPNNNKEPNTNTNTNLPPSFESGRNTPDDATNDMCVLHSHGVSYDFEAATASHSEQSSPPETPSRGSTTHLESTAPNDDSKEPTSDALIPSTLTTAATQPVEKPLPAPDVAPDAAASPSLPMSTMLKPLPVEFVSAPTTAETSEPFHQFLRGTSKRPKEQQELDKQLVHSIESSPVWHSCLARLSAHDVVDAASDTHSSVLPRDIDRRVIALIAAGDHALADQPPPTPSARVVLLAGVESLRQIAAARLERMYEQEDE